MCNKTIVATKILLVAAPASDMSLHQLLDCKGAMIAKIRRHGAERERERERERDRGEREREGEAGRQAGREHPSCAEANCLKPIVLQALSACPPTARTRQRVRA